MRDILNYTGLTGLALCALAFSACYALGALCDWWRASDERTWPCEDDELTADGAA